MIATALVGLNLAGAIATAKYYPRPNPPQPVTIYSRGGGAGYSTDGRWRLYYEDLSTGRDRLDRLVRVESLPPRPTLPRIWAPVMASVTISILVVIIIAAGLQQRIQTLAVEAVRAVGGAVVRTSRRLTVRHAMIAVALVGLNLAGLIATVKSHPRPAPNRSLHYERRASAGVWRKDPSGIWLLSVDEGDDRHPPGVIPPPKGPKPTPLRIWSPLLASSTVTLAVLIGTARFTLRRRMIAVALVGLNLAAAMATLSYYPQRFVPVAHTSERGVTVQLLPVPKPPLWNAWSPVIVSSAVTLAVLLVVARRSASRHRINQPDVGLSRS
jgi:hypothetical protein